MTTEEKKDLRKEFNEWNYPDNIPNSVFDWFYSKLEAKDKEIAELKSKISNALAVFHADGGHYGSEHGTDKALADAVTKYYDLHAAIDDEKMKVSMLSKMNFNLAKGDYIQQITDLKAEMLIRVNYYEDKLQANQNSIDDYYNETVTLKAEIERLKGERFEMPNDKTLIDFAILFNDGRVDPEQLSSMVGMCQMILDRLHEHGNVKEKSKQEIIDEQNQLKKIGRITWEGYWYEYEYRLAKDREDICLATKDPEKYCNGTFLYSTKDPGDGKEFVVTDTNEPVLKAQLLIKTDI